MDGTKTPLRVDHDKLYEIFRARDARFDGRFFVGVSSTGIYCRPICRARMPKKENCTFFTSAAEAEAAGFRPCITCRPEQAPGLSAEDASSVLALRAARLMDEECGSGSDLESIASRLGCTARHLRRVFAEAFHISPTQYLRTCRLLLAKTLLTDTNLSVLDVAMAAGFGSLRQFNNVFGAHYRMPPTALRKTANGRQHFGEEISVYLGYHTPYRFEELLRFFKDRVIPGVEMVRGGAYYRTVRLFNAKGEIVTGCIRVSDEPAKNALCVTISDSLMPVLPQVLGRIRQMFDLYCEPEIIRPVLADMEAMSQKVYQHGIRLPGSFDPFEMDVRAVLGQQITVKAACTLAGRIAETFGAEIETGDMELTRLFPTSQEIREIPGDIREHLGRLGVIAARADTIASLADEFADKRIICDSSANPEKEIKKLLDIKGIGDWSAQYIAMRAMAFTDAFPASDYGIKKAIQDTTMKERLAIAEQWRPWRSYAAICLWNSLE